MSNVVLFGHVVNINELKLTDNQLAVEDINVSDDHDNSVFTTTGPFKTTATTADSPVRGSTWE